MEGKCCERCRDTGWTDDIVGRACEKGSCPCHSTTKQEDWEKEFDKEFGDYFPQMNDWAGKNIPLMIKSFIKSLITKKENGILDIVELAAKDAERTTMGPHGTVSFIHAEVFVNSLQSRIQQQQVSSPKD